MCNSVHPPFSIAENQEGGFVELCAPRANTPTPPTG